MEHYHFEDIGKIIYLHREKLQVGWMDAPKVIEHEGTIREIRDGKARVAFLAKSACAHCQLKGVCSASEIEDKEVEVDVPGHTYQVGEKVNIVLARSLGIKALMYGYIFPFLLLMITLFVVYGITAEEIVSGLAALFVLVPYYGGLYLFRTRIGQEFKFFVRKFV